MRSVTRKLALTSAVAVAGLAAVVASISPAAADPSVTPAATDIVSVGSDTIQAYDTGLSAAYNATGPTQKYYSWDATPAGNITPKTGAATIARPNGSGSGLNALGANTSATVDVARSSRDQLTGTAGYFIPFAQDAVGWSAYTGGNAPHDLSTSDLQGIFGCTITNWNQITDIAGYTGPNAAIKVYVPQSGSGTRSFFLKALGLPSTESCWQTTTPEENEGSNSVFTGNVNAIFPYSLSHYVGQKYKGKGSGTDVPGALDALRSIDGTDQIDTVAQAWSLTDLTYIRNVYHVVRQAEWTSNAGLKKLFDKAVNGGYVCSNPSLITSYGFQTLGSGCGTVSAGALSGY